MIEKRMVDVMGYQMAYVEEGTGDPIVFLHGNPTSSYLWRNVIPHLAPLGRCVAPDLIGMGDSAKLPEGNPYSFVQHCEFLEVFLDEVGAADDVALVVHDWGSALGFDWANRHRDRISGIAYMEALVRTIGWEDWPEPSRDLFRAMRSDAGETIILEKNVFVERILPASVLRDLSDDEMAEYMRPYSAPGESRRPTLTWPREIPIEGEPADVHAVVDGYAGWLAAAAVPKLYIRVEPGFLTEVSDPGCRDWPHQEEVTVRGGHFVQEDSPDELGEAIATWYGNL